MASLPMAGDTLVVLTADHGDEFGEHGKLGHGETLFNGVLHVPLAFYWPGHTVRGSYDLPAQSVDIVPTVLDVVGIKPPPIPDGVSRRGLILGQTRTQPTQPAFAELKAIPFVGQRAAQGGCVQFGLPADCHVDRRAVQTERFKLISSKFPPYENLYDLQNDPHEAHDVAAQYPQEMERLRNMLVAYESGEPVAAAPAASAAPAIDAATRERLRALGYLK
jgi:arylsulfatase A-like enzyme